ncbi:MAG: demethoxyubiquinone hydroxylase family protein [Acidobacteriota bacterium]
MIHLLRSACSGELAAGYAYRGHWRSLPASAPERELVRSIEAEEWHHREQVLALLAELGARPNRVREAIFWVIGHSIGILCHLGGWFIPMYGAGRLESTNIVEYVDAARYAAEAGHPEMIDGLLTMAEVEWEHEKFFRGQIEGHRMLRLLPLWEAPPAKENIRSGSGRSLPLSSREGFSTGTEL